MDVKASGPIACAGGGRDPTAAKNGDISSTHPAIRKDPPPHIQQCNDEDDNDIRTNCKTLAEEKKGEEQHPGMSKGAAAAAAAINGVHIRHVFSIKTTSTENKTSPKTAAPATKATAAASRRHESDEKRSIPENPTTQQSEKLLEARQRLFHEHAQAIHFESAVQQEASGSAESASLLQVPMSLQTSSHGGRAFWNPRDGEMEGPLSRKKRKLSDITGLLSQLEDEECPGNDSRQSASNSTLSAEAAKPRRKGFRSESVEQVEEHVASRYREKLSKQQEKRQGGASTAATNTNGTTTVGNVKSLMLQFNECSVACLSKWVSNQIRNPRGGRGTNAAAHNKNNGKKSPQQGYMAAVRSRFRLCSICNRAGHYELECPEKTALQTQKLLRFASKKNQEQPQQPISVFDNQNPPPPNYLVHSSPDEVMVEMCSGFLFEQSATSFVNTAESSAASSDSSAHQHRSDNPQEDVTDIDGFLIRATKEGPIPSNRLVPLRVDDLVGWSSRGDVGTLLIGIVTSPPASSSEQDGDSAASTVRVRCISALAQGPGAVEEKDLKKIGHSFAIRRSRLMLVEDALKTPLMRTVARTPSTVAAAAAAVNPANGNDPTPPRQHQQQTSIPPDRPSRARTPPATK